MIVCSKKLGGMQSMIKGKEFEVSKEVYERAKAHSVPKSNGIYYMTDEDQRALFDVSILCGYGLYSCMVRKEGDKYICSYYTGSSCD